MLPRLFRFLLFLCLLMVPHANAVAAAEQESLTASGINGESAILIDGTTGAVLFEKNPDQPLFPASITKIATGIYAIENGNPDDIVTVSKRARYEEGTRVYLAEGEQVTLRKLEYGLLMNSGNDAATAIAEHLANSNEEFAEKLNAWLKEKTGVENTHFTNPHGLHDPNHVTTASDMAKIAQYAMKNPVFREIVATKQLKWVGKEWDTVIVNHNKLLFRYEGATGIKNGYTDQARHTLVVSAKRGETEFIAVTMKTASSELAYSDVTKMLDYGFAHYETKRAAYAGETFTLPSAAPQEAERRFEAVDDLFVTVPKGESFHRQVTPKGKLLVSGPEGILGEFTLKEEAAPVPAQPPSPASGALSGYRQTAKTLVFISWFSLNVMLILYLFARRQKQKRQAIREARRQLKRLN